MSPFGNLRFLVQVQKWLISLFLAFQLIQSCAGQCPSGYQSMGGKCAFMGSNRVPWQQATATCAQDNATLFFVQKQSDWDLIVQNVPQQQLTTIWIGLHYDAVTKTYTWADGTTYDPATDWAPWGTNHPNTLAGQCVSIKFDIRLNRLAWFMVSCGNTLAPICVKPQVTTIGTGTPYTFPSFADVTCPPSFTAFGGQCLVYSTNPVSYQDAQATCAANNSHVLFAKKEWLWKYAEYFIGSQLPNFWVGLSYNTATQQFEWSDGTTYNPATDWAAWCQDQPGTPGQWAGDCVNTMQDYATGEYCWYMADCTQGLYAVCLLNTPTTTAPLTTTTIPITVASIATTAPPITTTTAAGTAATAQPQMTTAAATPASMSTATGMTGATGLSTPVAAVTTTRAPAPTASQSSADTVASGQTAPTPITPNAMTTRPPVNTVTGCNPKVTGNFSPLLASGYLSYAPLQIVQNVTSSDCALACLGRPQCGSFDWNKQTSECHLLQQQFTDDCVNFVQNPDYQHYDLASVDQACYC